MLSDSSPVTQALLGTLMTWGLTAAGAAAALFVKGSQRAVLDASLGFAGGVMLAASYWSLLEPAIEMAADSGLYGAKGEFAFVPVAVGFFLGAAFVYGADVLMTRMGVHSPVALVISGEKARRPSSSHGADDVAEEDDLNNSAAGGDRPLRHRRRQHRNSASCDSAEEGMSGADLARCDAKTRAEDHWRRILLLIIAITVHNIPEGMAVGVGFGAVGKSASATFESARNLAIGIGIQNFPEGLAVSLPLKAAGFSSARSIWYGQLSGLVEPLAGVFGALLVSYVIPLLPYSLAFAAGAMVYVVIDDIVPEAQTFNNGKLASWGAIVGFIVMMSLDVGLG